VDKFPTTIENDVFMPPLGMIKKTPTQKGHLINEDRKRQKVIHKLSTGYPQVIHNSPRRENGDSYDKNPMLKASYPQKSAPPIIINLYIY